MKIVKKTCSASFNSLTVLTITSMLITLNVVIIVNLLTAATIRMDIELKTDTFYKLNINYETKMNIFEHKRISMNEVDFFNNIVRNHLK